MAYYHRTKILKIAKQAIFSDVQSASAGIWNQCSYQMSMYQWHRGYPHARADFYIGKDCEGWIDKRVSDPLLHSQSRQAIRKQYFKSWKSYQALKKSGGIEKPKPPYKKKKYMTTRWLKSAITFVDGSLLGKRVLLSMAQGKPKVEVQLPSNFNLSEAEHIATIDLVYNYGQWELHFSYRYEVEETETGGGVVGVDIGEIHPMATYEGSEVRIYNGRYIRSLYRLRNKVLAEFSQAISRCKRHSKRWWKLTRRKWKRIRKIDNQIIDGLQKHTTKFVKYCHTKGIGTIIVGDLTSIRDNVKVGKRERQKIHQWPFAKLTEMITYKAKVLGIKVKKINEAYTSQTCPSCGNRKKSNNREYTCKCGFTYHRDGVGAINIRAKYLGHLGVPVSGGNGATRMAPPLGFRLEAPVALA